MKIAKLEPSKRVAERWLVWLDDGSLLRVTENEVVSFALYQGMELSDETYDAIAGSAGRSAVRARALELAAARPMSRRELVEKLTARPRDGKKPPLADRELAEETAGWLEELGYLDDAGYARQVARYYSAKGYGERKVRDELFRRGVPRQLWEQALEELERPEEGIGAFLQKRFRGQAPDRKELKRAADALARRGYRWEEIQEGLARFADGIMEDEETTP